MKKGKDKLSQELALAAADTTDAAGSTAFIKKVIFQD